MTWQKKLTIKDMPQAEGALAEMSAISRKLSLIEGAMNEENDSAKARAQQESASLIARYNELEKAVKAFGALNKSRLFAEKRTLELPSALSRSVSLHASRSSTG